MAKYEATPIGQGFGSQSRINENFENIEENFQRVLYRDGSAPNYMLADLDMNSQRIINLPSATSASEPATYAQLLAAQLGGELPFVATFKETQTATSGQQVITLTLVPYIPGSNNLSLYINGVRMAGDAYTETGPNTITLSEALDAGDKIEAVINERTVESAFSFTGIAKEIFTATAGQTVFNITGVVYNPGSGNLSVYVDGVRQAGTAYSEDTPSSFSFLSPLAGGETVEIIVNERPVSADTVPASSVTATIDSVNTNVLDNLKKNQPITNVAALKALTGIVDGAIRQTLGYHTAGDGGHGLYQFNAASSATANDGTIIQPNSGGGRWELLEQKPTVKQFGAKGDGVTIDYTSFANAVSWYAVFGGDVPVPYGVYKLGTNTLTLPENVGLVGDGQSEPPTIGGALPTTAKRTLIEYTGTGNAIEIRGTFTPFVARRHINIGGFRLLTRSSGRAGISAHFMTRFHIFDIFFDGIPQYQLEMLSCYNGTVERCYFKGGTLYNLYFDINPSDSVFSGQTLFSKCDFWAGDTGTYIGQFSNIMAQLTFDTCHWQSNRIGFHLAGGRPPVLINPHFENNTDYDVYSNGTNNPIIDGGYCNSPDNAGTSIYYGGRDGSIKGMGFNEKASGNYIYLVGNQNTVENCNFRNPTGSTVVDIRVGGNNNTIRPNTYINETSGARTCVNIEGTANRTAVERQNFDASITSGFIVDSGVGTIFDGLIRFTTKTMALGGSADRNPFPATGYNGYIKSVKVVYPTGTTAGTGCQLQLGRSTAPSSVDATKYLNVTSAASQGTYTSVDLTGSLASDKFVASTDILTFNITGGATATGNVMAVIELTPYRVN